MEAAGLESESFDVPIHLGPGMPPQAHWVGTAAGGRDQHAEQVAQGALDERDERDERDGHNAAATA